jgi:hypothetical protein
LDSDEDSRLVNKRFSDNSAYVIPIPVALSPLKI